jgi:hypothetical protein
VALVDPTRVIQGVVTGIGFLGAGVIMRSGFNISGLTTAASIWASSVIGILVGVGFYMAAMGLAFFSAMIMIYLNRAVSLLPSRQAVAVTLRFKPGVRPQEDELRRAALERGYEIAGGSLTIGSDKGCQEWRFVALALAGKPGAPLSSLATSCRRSKAWTASSFRTHATDKHIDKHDIPQDVLDFWFGAPGSPRRPAAPRMVRQERRPSTRRSASASARHRPGAGRRPARMG